MPGRGWQWSKTPRATVKPTALDLAWAAGFLEGEGTFSFIAGGRYGTGKSEHVAAFQKNREPLDRLAAVFGGTISERPTGKDAGYGAGLIPGMGANWGVYGSRARGVMLTLYKFLSARRQLQVRSALKGERLPSSYSPRKPKQTSS